MTEQSDEVKLQKYLSSSIHWICPDMASLSDLCTISLIWKATAPLGLEANVVMKSIEKLKVMFDAMTDFERFTCGHRMVTYAAFDCAVSRAEFRYEAKECIDQIIDGMQGYSMAMGESAVYKRYVNIHNLYSSIPYFFNLPGPEYYLPGQAYTDSLDYLIAEKAECLHIACDLLRCSADDALKQLTYMVRNKLYSSILPKTPHKLLEVLFSEFDPNVFEALNTILITGIDMNKEWLATREWPLFEWDTLSLIVERACKADRQNVLEWLLQTYKASKYITNILGCVAEHSLSLLKKLLPVRLRTLAHKEDLAEMLYMGAYNNPDEGCLYYLESCDILPPIHMKCLGDRLGMSLCSLRSHYKFMKHILENQTIILSHWHLNDFLKDSDDQCLMLFLQEYGHASIHFFKTRPTALFDLLKAFKGSITAHHVIVQYLVTGLTEGKPETIIIQSLMIMLRNTFRKIPHLVDTNTAEEVIREMIFLAELYEELQTMLMRLNTTLTDEQGVLELNRPWTDMLPNGPACLKIIKFLVSHMQMQPTKYQVTLQNCLNCPGLLPYLKNVTFPPYNPVMTLENWDQAIMSQYSPSSILESKYLITVGQVSVDMMKEYCIFRRECNEMSLRDVVAQGVLCRIVDQQQVLNYHSNLIELPC